MKVVPSEGLKQFKFIRDMKNGSVFADLAMTVIGHGLPYSMAFMTGTHRDDK